MGNGKNILISGDNHNNQLSGGEITRVYGIDTANGLLTLTKGGNLGTVKVIFTSKSHKQYPATFSKNSNEYLLLEYLVSSPNQIFTAFQLAKVLKKPRQLAKENDSERRVRDTIRQLRVKLKLDNHNLDDPFMSANGFGLFCKVERDL